MSRQPTLTIQPCFRCPIREGCSLRKTIKARLKHMPRRIESIGKVPPDPEVNIRGLTITCGRLDELLVPGARVMIGFSWPTWTSHMSSEYPESEVVSTPVRAVVTMVQSRYRFAAVVEPGQHPPYDEWALEEGATLAQRRRRRFRKTMALSRIKSFLPGVTELCASGNPLYGGKCDTPDGHCQCMSMADGSMKAEGNPFFELDEEFADRDLSKLTIKAMEDFDKSQAT